MVIVNNIKVTLIILLTLFYSKTILAQTEDVVTAPKHIIGIFTGIQYHEIDDRMFNHKLNGYGGDIFYRHFFANLFDSTRLPIKMYLSANAGYVHYKHDNVKQENIAVTAGPSLLLIEYILEAYFTAEIGALYGTEEHTLNENLITSSNTKLFATLAFELVFPLSKSFWL